MTKKGEIISTAKEEDGAFTAPLRELFKESNPPLNCQVKNKTRISNIRKISDLTYEIFIKLINKTDWHLRRLVVYL